MKSWKGFNEKTVSRYVHENLPLNGALDEQLYILLL